MGPWWMWVQPEGEVVRVRFCFLKWGVERGGMVGGGGRGVWWSDIFSSSTSGAEIMLAWLFLDDSHVHSVLGCRNGIFSQLPDACYAGGGSPQTGGMHLVF